MKLNKKGFTLVELLAVIVILAVIMLVAVTAVGPAITNSKKGALFSSASSVQDAASLYASATGITSTRCLRLDTLEGTGYFTNKDKNLYGAILITVSSNNYTYKMWLSNADYSITNKSVKEIDDKGTGFDSTKAANNYYGGTTTTVVTAANTWVKVGSTYHKCDGSGATVTTAPTAASSKIYQ